MNVVIDGKKRVVQQVPNDMLPRRIRFALFFNRHQAIRRALPVVVIVLAALFALNILRMSKLGIMPTSSDGGFSVITSCIAAASALTGFAILAEINLTLSQITNNRLPLLFLREKPQPTITQ